MKAKKNTAPKASEEIVKRALAVGCRAEIIEKSKPAIRRQSSLGSTHAPQKVVIIDDTRMSIGQARQYVEARERKADGQKTEDNAA